MYLMMTMIRLMHDDEYSNPIVAGDMRLFICTNIIAVGNACDSGTRFQNQSFQNKGLTLGQQKLMSFEGVKEIRPSNRQYYRTTAFLMHGSLSIQITIERNSNQIMLFVCNTHTHSR